MALPCEFIAQLEKALEVQEQKSIAYCFIALDPQDCYYNMHWTMSQASSTVFKYYFGRVYTQEEYNEITSIIRKRISRFLDRFPRFRVGGV
ncbi:MAG: hypothetical protein ACP5UZ_05975 [Thermoplasmata archaeon]